MWWKIFWGIIFQTDFQVILKSETIRTSFRKKTDIKKQSIFTILQIYSDLLLRNITNIVHHINKKKKPLFLPNNFAVLTVPNFLSDLCNHCHRHWLVFLRHLNFQNLARTRCPLRKTGNCDTQYSRTNSFPDTMASHYFLLHRSWETISSSLLV